MNSVPKHRRAKDAAPHTASLDRLLVRIASAGAQPKYGQLRDAIQRSIEAGEWKSGERLPPEQALVAATPFSLGTVQRALRSLVEAGIVVRTQGSGTYVATSDRQIEDVAHCRFLNDDETGHLPLFSRVVSRARVRGKGPWSRYFPNDKRRLVQIDRMLNVNAEFDVYSRFVFDASRFPSLATRPLSQLNGQNFKEVLRIEFLVPATDISQRMLFSAMPSAVANRLRIPASLPSCIMEVVARSGNRDVLYFQQFFIPGTSRKLVTGPLRSVP